MGKWLREWLEERLEWAIGVYVVALLVMFLLAPHRPGWVGLVAIPMALVFGVAMVVTGVRGLRRRRQ